MKKKQDPLYILVKSLTKNEKRFFRLHTNLFSKNKKPNYWILFEILEKMPEYDHALVLKKIKTTIEVKNLSQLKHYLKEQILETLVLFHKSNNETIENLEKLGIVVSLTKRSFTEEAEKILQASKKSALKNNENVLSALVLQELIVLESSKERRERRHNENMISYYKEQLTIIEKEKETMENSLKSIQETTQQTKFTSKCH